MVDPSEGGGGSQEPCVWLSTRGMCSGVGWGWGCGKVAPRGITGHLGHPGVMLGLPKHHWPHATVRVHRGCVLLRTLCISAREEGASVVQRQAA